MKNLHSLDMLIDYYMGNVNNFDTSTDKGWNEFEKWLDDNKIELFKCSSCGDKYNTNFTATNDTSICRWCSGEEK